jgi:short-subunit dehydrogenase
VQSFTEAVRYELKDKGVGVTALLPGATDTDFFNKADMLSSKIVQEGKLADPAEVAQDGYDALMADKDMVVSGFKNKMQVKMGSLKSDEKNAENMGKQQEPVETDQDE